MRLVILGGGFCGTLVAKAFDKRHDIESILIDQKSFFEYTPSLHKVPFELRYREKICRQYSDILQRTQIITDPLVQLTPKFVETKKERLPFTFLVISTGIDYPIFLENTANVFTIKSGIESLALGKALSKADTILIIGGGLIGTEFAGELITKTKNKHVILVHSKDRLLERNPVLASKYAQEFLEDRGLRIILQEKIVARRGQNFITDKGQSIAADVAIWAAGIRWNPSYMTGFRPSVYSTRNALNVNPTLQLKGYPNIFVGGDVANTMEEKTAFNAFRHARLITKNILRLWHGKPLLQYKPRTFPLTISLGRSRGIIAFNKFTITGLLPALIKWLIEWVDMQVLYNKMRLP